MAHSVRKLPLGVLISGSGSNLQALIDAERDGRMDATIRVVISDVPTAMGLERARHAGIPAVALERSNFPSRTAFEEAICTSLQEHGVELVCLAGFMRIIGKTMLTNFPDRILNIHPALLPSFPGLHGQQQALEYGVKIAGCTVHFVDAQTDHGPIVCQATVPVLEDDTEQTLSARILKEEHRIYPEAVQLVASERVRLEGRRAKIISQ